MCKNVRKKGEKYRKKEKKKEEKGEKRKKKGKKGRRREEKIEEEDVCMICLVNPPNTMVLPCEHCVVCKECSIQLKNTNDRKICVRCRRPITNILD